MFSVEGIVNGRTEKRGDEGCIVIVQHGRGRIGRESMLCLRTEQRKDRQGGGGMPKNLSKSHAAWSIVAHPTGVGRERGRIRKWWCMYVS